jgi:hypothetical protein
MDARLQGARIKRDLLDHRVDQQLERAALTRLPPHSPDLNPIEKLLAKLKALLRKAAAKRSTPYGTTSEHCSIALPRRSARTTSFLPDMYATKNLSVNNVRREWHFSVGDNRGGQVIQSEEAPLQLFIAYQQFAEAVEPAVRELDDPPPGFLARIALLVFHFLPATFDVRNVVVESTT